MNNCDFRLPSVISDQFILDFISLLHQATPSHTPFTPSFTSSLLERSSTVFKSEPNLLNISFTTKSDENMYVITGDTHGQLKDVLQIFTTYGLPSSSRIYHICFKGNHESLSVCSLYGFKDEINDKYKENNDMIFNAFGNLFKTLPLAAVVAKTTFCSHAGIFARNHLHEPGRVEEINDVNRFVDEDLDPLSIMNQLLWSDPELADGFAENEFRGAGIVWGSKQSAMFLTANNLKFIIRGHESADCRAHRTGYRLGGITDGYVQDHFAFEGGSYTVFSAPAKDVEIFGMLQPCRGAVGLLLYPYDELVFQQIQEVE
ncbi:Serine/threonine-protein phosphatase [Entamoeba marina]